MKPSPKMAKFVLTTWAACFARQKPVSTSANPACMKITRIAPMITHSRLTCPPSTTTGSACIGMRPVESDSIHYLLCLFGWPVCHARRQLTYVAFRRNIPFVSC